MVGHWRRLRRWRETLLSGFEEMTVVVRIIRVSIARRIFASICAAFVEEVILDMFGGRETSIKLGVLSCQSASVFVRGSAAEVEAERCVYFVESETLRVWVVDQSDRFRGLLVAVIEIYIPVRFVREGEFIAIIEFLRGRSNDSCCGRSRELWLVIDLDMSVIPFRH